MREQRGLSDQAIAELAELRRIGVNITDSDIVLINALCWEIESPSNRIELARGRPIQVGGAWLWPRTIAACEWFNTIGCECGNAALAYAQAHGREEIELAGKKEVKAWRKKLTCTDGELAAACMYIESQGESDELPKDPTEKTPTCGQIVIMMHSLHGGDVDMWERYVSLSYVVDMLTTSAIQAQADSGKSGNILKDRANLALAYAIHEIVKRDKEMKTNVG